MKRAAGELPGLLLAVCLGARVAASVGLRRQWQTEARVATRIEESSAAGATTSFCEIGNGWVKEWADEFDGHALDTDSWAPIVSRGKLNAASPVAGLGATACRTAQCRERNVRVAGGKLRLLSERDASDPSRFYTGAVTTKGLRGWAGEMPYRLCVRAQLPRGGPHGQGLWPAHWMLPDNGYSDRCLDEGEMDIMEMINGDGNVYSTYHWMASWPKKQCADFNAFHKSDVHRALMPEDWSTSFHEYAVERSSDHIAFAIDGRVVFRTVASEQGFTLSRTPFFLILNTAIGGSWPGEPSPLTEMPAEHAVDYVRVVRRPARPGPHVQVRHTAVPECVYINLARRVDRRTRLEAELRRVGLSCTRVEAVDGKAIGISGREGCRRSHLAALGRIEASGAAYGLVLEDDARWVQSPKVVRNLLTKAGNAIRDHPVILASCNGWGDPEAGVPWLEQVETCQTTSAYIIRRDYIPVLRDMWEKHAGGKLAIDITWKSLQKKDHWAMLQPRLVVQGASWSDIERRYTNYGVLL